MIKVKTRLRAWAQRFVLERIRTARHVMRFSFFLYRSRTLYIGTRGTLSYGEVESRVLRLHALLLAHGIRKGDVVFTWLPETLEQFECRLACHEGGAVYAALHRDLGDETVLELARRAQPRCLIYDPLLAGNLLERLCALLPGLITLPIGAAYENALAMQHPMRSRAPLTELDHAALHMTSGTTGVPKIMGVRHRLYFNSLRMLASALGLERAPRHGGREVLLLGAPLSGPGYSMLFPAMLVGGTLVHPPLIDAETVATWMARHRATRAFMTPSTLSDLLDLPGIDRQDFSALSLIYYGAEMMPAAKLAAAVRFFGPILQQGYGSFEALPPVTWLLPHQHVAADGEPAHADILGSAGRVVPGVRVKIVDEQDQPLPAGDIGQIAVRTPLAFEGYWHKPEMTEAVVRDGWVYLGDMGYFDAAGYLHVPGRRADTVRRHGQAIYPRQVEEVAHEHAAVRDACLVQHGEHAVLVFSPRHAWQRHDRTELERLVRDLLHARLPRALRPDRVMSVDSIPRSVLHKVLRRSARELVERASSPSPFPAPAHAAISGATSTS